MNMSKKAGFTLIELMIVVVIVAILASIAFASYQNNIISANRTDGRKELQRIATTLEKCRALNGTYTTNCSIANGASITSEKGLYTIAVKVTSSTYSLTATPVSGKTQAKDTDCTALTLNNLGQKSGSGADSSRCW
jgi:type IV pilus assembly protein PilE